MALTVFANAVEYDDGVVDRKSNTGEYGGDEHRVDLDAGDLAEEGKDADEDEGVVDEGGDGGDSVAYGPLNIAEAPGEVDENGG